MYRLYQDLFLLKKTQTPPYFMLVSSLHLKKVEFATKSRQNISDLESNADAESSIVFQKSSGITF